MINLLPPEVKVELKYARRNATLRWYVLLIILVVALVSALLVGAMWFSNRDSARAEQDLRQIETQLAAYKDVETEATNLRDSLNAVQELFVKQTDYLAVLRDIEKAIIPSATLQSLSLTGDETKPLSLQFSVPNETAAASLRISLEESDRFSFVDIEAITKQDGAGFDVSYKLAFEAGKAR